MAVNNVEEKYSDYLNSKNDNWEFANGILYNLCKEYPKHDDEHVIVAKLWLIGRSYAASIERSANNSSSSEVFYYSDVAPKILDIGGELDNNISKILKYDGPVDHIVKTILETHKLLTDTFHKITGLNNRSLASKYLHFHCPDHFFLYDSRACSSIKKYVEKPDKKILDKVKYDPEYGVFFCRMLEFQKFLKDKNIKDVTPRDLDSFLLNESENELVK